MIILLLNIFYDQSIFPTAIGTEAFTLAPVDLEDLSSWDGMRIGQVTGGDIGPFSSIKLEIIFNPMIPGAVDVDFEIRFTDPLSNTVSFQFVEKIELAAANCHALSTLEFILCFCAREL